MNTPPPEENLPQELKLAYSMRFEAIAEYRLSVWKVLTSEFFQKWIPKQGNILDLGCGYGEFINQIEAGTKYGMDLNPTTKERLNKDITFLQQDCSKNWPLEENTLDAVFTSNFFEHLPDKKALHRTVLQALRCLKPGGRLIALGPNARSLGGHYWDFWDHHVCLTNQSLCELLELVGFDVEHEYEKFLPYTMVRKSKPPLFLVSLYLRLPLAWKFYGKQFLLVARKP